jgi:hypothetical protein
MMNRDDMVRFGILRESEIALTTAVEGGVQRRVAKLKALEYDIPPATCAAYLPECKPLIPLRHQTADCESHAVVIQSSRERSFR